VFCSLGALVSLQKIVAFFYVFSSSLILYFV
jgi:hypothetical protein